MLTRLAAASRSAVWRKIQRRADQVHRCSASQEPRELVDAVVHQSDTAVPSSSGSAAAVVVPPTVPDSAGGFVCILCARGFKSEEMLKE